MARKKVVEGEAVDQVEGEATQAIDPLSTEAVLAKLRADCEKNYGTNILVKLGDESTFKKVDFLPLNIPGVDDALGGGLGCSRIAEIYGPESSGKTTLALHAIASGQKQGICAFVDAEHAFDPVYAANLGVNIKDLWFSQPDSGEQALDFVEDLVGSGKFAVIVVDSVAALTPQAEIDGDMGDAHVGLQARLMSQALRKITAKLGKTKTVLIFINQIRMKIGVMFGNPETTTGGNALKFYASQRIDVRKRDTNSDADGEAISNDIKIKVVKNKLAPPFRIAEERIVFGKGIDKAYSLLKMAVALNIVDKKGAWYNYNEEKIGQGEKNTLTFLEDNEILYEEIAEKVRQMKKV